MRHRIRCWQKHIVPEPHTSATKCSCAESTGFPSQVGRMVVDSHLVVVAFVDDSHHDTSGVMTRSPEPQHWDLNQRATMRRESCSPCVSLLLIPEGRKNHTLSGPILRSHQMFPCATKSWSSCKVQHHPQATQGFADPQRFCDVPDRMRRYVCSRASDSR